MGWMQELEHETFNLRVMGQGHGTWDRVMGCPAQVDNTLQTWVRDHPKEGLKELEKFQCTKFATESFQIPVICKPRYI